LRFRAMCGGLVRAIVFITASLSRSIDKQALDDRDHGWAGPSSPLEKRRDPSQRAVCRVVAALCDAPSSIVSTKHLMKVSVGSSSVAVMSLLCCVQFRDERIVIPTSNE